MVSAGTQTHHRALPSSTGRKRKSSARPLFYGMIATGAGLASAGFLAGALAMVQSLAHSTAGGEQARFETALSLNPILRAEPGERNIRPEKFVRAPLPMADQVAQSGLTEAAIKASRQRMAVVARLTGDRETSVKAHGLTADAIRAFQTRTTAVASIAPVGKAKTSVTAVASLHPGKDKALFAAAAKASVPSGLASALVDPNAGQEAMPKPFSLVLAEREAEGEMAGLPESVPLPISRPEALVRKPADEKPVRELAYAKPQSILEDDDSDKPIVPTVPRRRGGKIAYYDISAGVVHMPSGEKLEAHSGIGEMRDNPKYTHVKMRGPTPPGTYKMTMRESLFHGVAAIRLTPTNGVAPKGRTGLLAHSYLLKRRGDSHGCVAFADYNRFLRAFKGGEVDTMIIVEKMSAWGGMTASADDGKKGFWPWQRKTR